METDDQHAGNVVYDGQKPSTAEDVQVCMIAYLQDFAVIEL